MSRVGNMPLQVAEQLDTARLDEDHGVFGPTGQGGPSWAWGEMGQQCDGGWGSNVPGYLRTRDVRAGKCAGCPLWTPDLGVRLPVLLILRSTHVCHLIEVVTMVEAWQGCAC